MTRADAGSDLVTVRMKLFESLLLLSFIVLLLTPYGTSGTLSSELSNNGEQSRQSASGNGSSQGFHAPTPGVSFKKGRSAYYYKGGQHSFGGSTRDGTLHSNSRFLSANHSPEISLPVLKTPDCYLKKQEENPNYVPLHTVHPHIGHCTLDRFDLDRAVQLGKGGFGRALRVPHKYGDSHFVLKHINPGKVITHSREAMREETLMSRLSSESSPPYVARYYCSIWSSTEGLYLVQELLNGDNLATYLKKHKSLSRREVARYTAHVIQALRYIHSRCIVHRDIKPENLVLHNGHLRLVDFGLAREDCEGQLTSFAGTYDYIAPAIYLGEPYGNEVDYYSLAVIVYEMFMGRQPYSIPSGEEWEVTAKKFTENTYYIPKTSDTLIDELIDALMKTYQRQDQEDLAVLEIFEPSDWQ